jgi:hypothetical protein
MSMSILTRLRLLWDYFLDWLDGDDPWGTVS